MEQQGIRPIETKESYQVLEMKIPVQHRVLFIKFKADLEKEFDMYYSSYSFSNRCLLFIKKYDDKNIHIRVLIEKKSIDEFKKFVQNFWTEAGVVPESD